ncbi:MAG TPA: restriction endonuclease [Candidatus Intestinimonas merdavium]|uniref:Restriction endonuclease n=1 Tax=Candidatus Intestinimonas merdavium TaxID=2838622 RepID=A0A9D1Z636_9FIRM|nr:restriction endonuclease [Candidatus Intestinimonas merdavium]
MQLTIDVLVNEARIFSQMISLQEHPNLVGVTDGKAVGTYVEHMFQNHLSRKYEMTVGSSASGIDLPSVNTDIKTTSYVQPQSSCPFKSARQKIFGLGYNLLVFVYNKQDTPSTCHLQIKHCAFIEAGRTADYTLTAQLRDMLRHNANREDIIALLNDRNVPGDDITYHELADEILSHPPQQGYLTISNALQWRLQYKRVIELNNSVGGVVNFAW